MLIGVRSRCTLWGGEGTREKLEKLEEGGVLDDCSRPVVALGVRSAVDLALPGL
jgi:hypothetical protein